MMVMYTYIRSKLCDLHNNNDDDNNNSCIYNAQHSIITPVIGYNFKTALVSQCTISTPKRASLAELPIMALQTNTYSKYLSRPTGSPFI